MSVKKQKDEILWNIINSALTGGVAFLGAIIQAMNDGFTWEELGVALIVGIITGLSIAIIKFQNYWQKEESEYSTKIFNLIKIA